MQFITYSKKTESKRLRLSFPIQILLGGALFISLWAMSPYVFSSIPYSLRINTTNSVPYTLFIGCTRAPKDSIERNSFVCFQHPVFKQRMVKRVVGFPQDAIDIRLGAICINETNHGVFLQKSPRSELKLSPIEIRTIPDGFVYVAGDHPESFDSRYEEFGLIKIEEIQEVLWPLF